MKESKAKKDKKKRGGRDRHDECLRGGGEMRVAGVQGQRRTCAYRHWLARSVHAVALPLGPTHSEYCACVAGVHMEKSPRACVAVRIGKRLTELSCVYVRGYASPVAMRRSKASRRGGVGTGGWQLRSDNNDKSIIG